MLTLNHLSIILLKIQIMVTSTTNSKKPMPTRFFHVSKGNFTETIKNDTFTYGSITGSVEGIELRTNHKKDGEEFQNWHLLMSDKSTGERYDIILSRTSNVLISIIRSLASDEGLRSLHDVEICASPAAISAFTNIKVIAGGHSLSWLPCEVPPLQCYRKEGRIVTCDEERFKWVSTIVDLINKKIESEKYHSPFSDGNMYPEYNEICEEGQNYDDEI